MERRSELSQKETLNQNPYGITSYEVMTVKTDADRAVSRQVKHHKQLLESAGSNAFSRTSYGTKGKKEHTFSVQVAGELRNSAVAANKDQHETMSQKTQSNRSLYKQDETIAASPKATPLEVSKPASVGSHVIRSKEQAKELSQMSLADSGTNFVSKREKES